MNNSIGSPLQLAVVGGGAMGSALLAGIVKSGLIAPEAIGVSEPNREQGESLARALGIHYLPSNQAAVSARTIVLAVKPQVFGAVATDLAPHVPRGLVVSILAGISLEQLTAAFPECAVVRAMPNTPALVGAGMTAISLGGMVDDGQTEIATAIFAAVGKVCVVPESYMDAVTAVSGSGPGYIALFVESIVDGGVRAGLPRAIATELAIQTVFGTAQLLSDRQLHPAELKDRVTSPGGTTIAGISVLEDRGVRGAIMRAIEAACDRSRQLRR